MRFEEALTHAKDGALITRVEYGMDFISFRNGEVFRGSFIGETGIADMRKYIFEEEDKKAENWSFFQRTLPDPWEGCDMPTYCPSLPDKYIPH